MKHYGGKMRVRVGSYEKVKRRRKENEVNNDDGTGGLKNRLRQRFAKPSALGTLFNYPIRPP
jgi:hypothetical protein